MQKCLSCSRTDDDIGKCGSPLTCPKTGMEVNPKTDVVIRCDLCDITRAVSVETLTKHRDPRLDNACQSNVCGAYVVRPEPAAPVAPAKAIFEPAAELARDEPAPPAPAKKPAAKAPKAAPPAPAEDA